MISGVNLVILVGNGIINADGDLWRVQRKAGLRFFSNAQLKSFIDDVLPPLLENTRKVLDEAAQSRTIVDMQEIFLELTTRLMGTVAYDVCLQDFCRRVFALTAGPIDGYPRLSAFLESIRFRFRSNRGALSESILEAKRAFLWKPPTQSRVRGEAFRADNSR